jgi:hypothetical protein
MEEIEELAEYFGYALKQGDLSIYYGTVVFNVSVPQLNNQKVPFCVRISRSTSGGEAQIWLSLPPDNKHDVWVDISLPDLLHVYSGKAGAADVASLVLGGRIRVGWFKFAELKTFAESFDYRTEKWISFYRWRAAQGKDAKGEQKADDMLRDQWAKALEAEKKDGKVTLVDESGRLIPAAETAGMPDEKLKRQRRVGQLMVEERLSLQEATEREALESEGREKEQPAVAAEEPLLEAALVDTTAPRERRGALPPKCNPDPNPGRSGGS